MIVIGIIMGVQSCLLTYFIYKTIKQRYQKNKVIPVVYVRVCNENVKCISPDKTI